MNFTPRYAGPMTAPEGGLDLLVTRLKIRLADPELRTDDRLSCFKPEGPDFTPEQVAMEQLDSKFERMKLFEPASQSGSFDKFEDLQKRSAQSLQSRRRNALPGLPAPLSLGSLPRFERQLGFPVPPEIAAIFSLVADGGFGPALGLFPLATMAEKYCSLRCQFDWPDRLLPLLACSKGLVCLEAQSRAVGFYSRARFKKLAPDFLTFLDLWLDGRLKLRSTGRTPGTEVIIGHPRVSATDFRGKLATVARGIWQRISAHTSFERR